MDAQVHVRHPADGVAVLLMDNGPGNFATPPLHERLEAALAQVRESGTRVVVLGSAVKGFFVSHGHIGDTVRNLTGRGELTGDPRAFLRVQKELDTGPMVSIAAIDGQAWGGGAELAWSCDFRVASEASTLGQPEVMIGLPPAGGATRIARMAGEAAAKRLVLDGRPVNAAEAYRLGLVDRLVPTGAAVEEAVAWAEWLAGRAPGDLARNKELIVGGRDLEMGAALRRETSLFVSRFSDEPTVERALAVQRRYDEGADSYDAFALPRS
jgi:enoyl-CoA hydratase